MSLIYAEQLSARCHQLFCEGCLSPVDIVSREELSGMVRSGYRVFCPKCEAPGEYYHPVFAWEGEPFWVVIDGQLFCIDWPNSVRDVERKYQARLNSIKEFLINVKPENSDALACLVSTYLHNLQEKEGNNA